jgi:hypothetical protein
MPEAGEQERDSHGETPTTGESHVIERGGGDTPRNAEPRVSAEHRREIGGPQGPEPTRFGDWERAGRCIDF